jgi:hypothetical protein
MDDVIVGADLSSKTLAFTLSEGPRTKVALMRNIPQYPQGSFEAFWQTLRYFESYDGDRELFAVLEEPVTGVNTRSTIVQAYVNGAVQAALLSLGFTVILVNNKVWKKEVIGNGNASKEAISGWVAKDNPSFHSWTEATVPKVSTQDVYDSYAIRSYAHVLFRRTRHIMDGTSQL